MARWRQAKKPSYFVEMLKHPAHTYSALGSLAAAGLLAIPLGPLAALPVVGYLAGTAIASLFVPGSKAFQEKVDRQKHHQMREAARQHLVSEIVARLGRGNQYWAIYDRLLQRVISLRKVAEQGSSAVTIDDVERLDDATVDFLGLWLGRIAIHERGQSFNEKEIHWRIAEIDKKLDAVPDEQDRKRLLKARNDFQELIRRREEMKTRDAAAEAAMLSMADTFDEVYQRVMANPNSPSSVRETVGFAVEQMNIEEELDYVLVEEVDAMLGKGNPGIKARVES